MINVQYPFLDLSKALLILLQNIHPKDKDKPTLYKTQQINVLLKHLFEIHTHKLNFPKEILTLDTGKIDTINETALLDENINQLVLAVKSKTKPIEVTKEEYGYCWLLQQYIRQALNNQELLHYNFYHPFLEMMMQSLASHYRSIDATESSLVKVEIVGEAGGVWIIEKARLGWQSSTAGKSPDTVLYVDQQIAWLLFSDALHVNEIGQFYQIIGNKKLGSHFLSFRTMLLR